MYARYSVKVSDKGCSHPQWTTLKHVDYYAKTTSIQRIVDSIDDYFDDLETIGVEVNRDVVVTITTTIDD